MTALMVLLDLRFALISLDCASSLALPSAPAQALPTSEDVPT